MATITSNGSGGGDWSDTATWVGGVVPQAADDVIIAAGDEITLDVDTATLNTLTQNGTSTITQASQVKAISVSALYEIKGGATATNLVNTIVSAGSFLVTGIVNNNIINITGCDIQVDCQVFPTGYTTILNLTNSTLTKVILGTGGGPDTLTVNGGTFALTETPLSQAMALEINDAMITGMTLSSNSVALALNDSEITAGSLNWTTAICNNSSIGTSSAVGITASSTYTFYDCSTRIDVVPGVGIVTVVANGGDLNGSSFTATNSDIQVFTTDCDISNTTWQGSNNPYYAMLDVINPLPDAYWSGVATYGYALFTGYIRPDFIALGGNGNWWGGDSVGGACSFICRNTVNLANDTFNGGTWKIYSGLSYTSMTAGATTYFKLMTPQAVINHDSFAEVRYAGALPGTVYKGGY